MLTQRRPATSRQTSVGVWGSGRRGRRPQAAAHPIVRLSTIREPPPASPRQQIPFQVSPDRASPERGGDRNAGGGVQAQAVRVGNADPQSMENSMNSEKSAAPIYGGQRSSPEPAAAGGTGPSCVGSADQQSAGNSADSEKSAAPIYGGWFRVLSGGSKRVQAQPARRQQVGAGSVCPSRQCRPVISRRFLEIRRIREVQSMLPEFVAGTRGSKWNRALPG